MQTHFSSEDDLSKAVKKWLNKLNDVGEINTLHFHVPNEFIAVVNRVKAWSKKKSIGCLAGAPDWVIISKDNHCLIELKHAKTMSQAINKMSDAQKKVAKLCADKGINYHVVFDKESFIKALQASRYL